MVARTPLGCLDSLARVTEPPIQVVCVDNGSTDGSVEAVRSAISEVDADRERAQPRLRRRLQRRDPAGLLEQGARVGGAASTMTRWSPPTRSRGSPRRPRRPSRRRDPGGQALPRRPARSGLVRRPALPGRGSATRAGTAARDAATVPATSAMRPTDRATGALMAVSRAAIEKIGLLDEGCSPTSRTSTGRCGPARPASRSCSCPGPAPGTGSAPPPPAPPTTATTGRGTWSLVCERHRPLPPPLSWLRRAVILATSRRSRCASPNRRAALRGGLGGLSRRAGERLGAAGSRMSELRRDRPQPALPRPRRDRRLGDLRSPA